VSRGWSSADDILGWRISRGSIPKRETTWREVAHAQSPNIVSAVPLRSSVHSDCWGGLGCTEVDDDGNAVREREISAKFSFYDIEILSH